MADILTIEEYKGFMGVQPGNTREDTQIAALLPAATRAVKNFTGRSFDVTAGTSSARQYQYDHCGMLDIDDCTAVVSVSTDAGVMGQTYDLRTDEWTAMPQDDSDVFYYLLIQGGYMGISPEMGFERNLDQLPTSYRQPLFTVTATWGWPSIPEDVKLAGAIIVKSMLGSSGTRNEDLTAEAIEGFSRSWGGKTGGLVALAIPNKARDILMNYVRVLV